VLGYALINPFVTSANQDDAFELRESSRDFLAKEFSGR
jgi:hypothetical protein